MIVGVEWMAYFLKTPKTPLENGVLLATERLSLWKRKTVSEQRYLLAYAERAQTCNENVTLVRKQRNRVIRLR